MTTELIRTIKNDGSRQPPERLRTLDQVLSTIDDPDTFLAQLLAGYSGGDLTGRIVDFADVTIATGAVLALNAEPAVLVAAPAAGYALIFEGVRLTLDYNSVAYGGIDAAEDLIISYTNGSGQEVGYCESTGFLDATADAYRWVYPHSDAVASPTDVIPVPAAALVLSLLSGEVIDGNSPLKVRTYYRTIPT